jgi:hypothetical protein
MEVKFDKTEVKDDVFIWYITSLFFSRELILYISLHERS